MTLTQVTGRLPLIMPFTPHMATWPRAPICYCTVASVTILRLFYLIHLLLPSDWPLGRNSDSVSQLGEGDKERKWNTADIMCPSLGIKTARQQQRIVGSS